MQVDQRLVLIALLINIGCCSQADEMIVKKHRTKRHFLVDGTTRPVNCKGARKNRRECKNDQVVSDSDVMEALNSISWLRRLQNSSFFSIPGLSETPSNQENSKFYQLALGVKNQPFHECTTPSYEIGHCRFLQHCILEEFTTSFSTFLSYACFIEGRYLGVCCPDSRDHQQITVTSQTRPTTIATKPPTRPTTVVTTPRAKPTTPPNYRGCGVNSLVKTRIAGGRNGTVANKYPWAAVLLKDTGIHYCGGVLITSSHVMTAAHCVDRMKTNAITIRLGEHSFDHPNDSPHKDFSIMTINIHENYNAGNTLNDIAILTMTRTTVFSISISPICLPTGDDFYTDDLATVIGWGSLYYGGPLSRVLQEVSIPIWRNSECKAAFTGHNLEMFDKYICAGDKSGGNDSCEGDSGGPLMLQLGTGIERRWYVIGVVAWGIRCGEPGLPGVYARVTKYTDWIGSNTI